MSSKQSPAKDHQEADWDYLQVTLNAGLYYSLKANPNRCKKMTVLYKIEPNLKLIYYAGFGLCTSSEILHAKRSAFKDPLRTIEMKIILDIRYAELDVDIEDMRTLVEMNRELIKSGQKPEKTAVVSFNKYINILEETFQLLAEGLPLKTGIFNQIKDAIKWLELSHAEMEINQISKSLLINQ